MNWVSIGSDNGLPPIQRQAIIWSNAGLLSIKWTIRNKLKWNFNQNTKLFIHENASENIVCAKCQPFGLGLDVLRLQVPIHNLNQWWQLTMEEQNSMKFKKKKWAFFFLNMEMLSAKWQLYYSGIRVSIKDWMNQNRDVIKTCDLPLTHWGLVTPISDKDLGQHWLR